MGYLPLMYCYTILQIRSLCMMGSFRSRKKISNRIEYFSFQIFFHQKNNWTRICFEIETELSLQFVKSAIKLLQFFNTISNALVRPCSSKILLFKKTFPTKMEERIKTKQVIQLTSETGAWHKKCEDEELRLPFQFQGVLEHLECLLRIMLGHSCFAHNRDSQ